MHIRLMRRLLCVAAIPGLALAGTVVSASPAAASSSPALSKAVQTYLCASTTNSHCGQTLTASIPAGSAVSVTCDHGSDYYIVVTAHQNQEGYVPKGDVSGAPAGLTDCDTAAHRAIWAAAWAIGYLGQDYDVDYCLTFVIDAWRSTGDDLPGSTDPITWWSSYAGDYEHATSGDRFDTPPRGALVFWGGDKYNSEGHVAIAVGNGWLVSTQEGDSSDAVHLITVDARNAEPGVGKYMGWVLPSVKS
jgi:cell wall-associated NlpC family hydrolase